MVRILQTVSFASADCDFPPTLVFIVQEARRLDVDILSQIDVLAAKELSDVSRGFERPQLRGLIRQDPHRLPVCPRRSPPLELGLLRVR